MSLQISAHYVTHFFNAYFVAVSNPNLAWVTCDGEHRWVVLNHNIALRTGFTADQCKQLCLANSECKSFDFRPSDGRCSPNDVTRLQAGSSWEANAPYVYHEYTCLTASDLCLTNPSVTQNDTENCLIDSQGECVIWGMQQEVNAEIILRMGPVNEKRRYIVTSSVSG